LKYNPWCIFTLVEMGNVQARLKQDDQAIDFYKRTLKLAPDFQQAQESLARAYFRKQDFSKAAEWARKTGARTNENMAFLLSLE